MKEVSFLEKLAENLLEGSFSRALKPKLQPVQIAKALARAMERSQVVAADGPLVANQYQVLLHPADFAGFAGFQASMERELADYLQGYAARHGLRTLSFPTVQLLPAEPPAALGRVVVRAALADVEPEPPTASRELPGNWQGTAVMPVAAPEPQPEGAEPPRLPAFLVDEEGQTLPLTDPDTSIGRAMDNDLVLETGCVSRHHARIVWESGRYLVLDLDSTNGTFVSGSRVTREPLAGGEELSFGGAQFTFRLADPQN
ncbi:MAG: FhaA domain-containing protein [Chloroflexota bacterium]